MAKYTYQLRPAHGSSELLIEFLKGTFHAGFIQELLIILQPIQFKPTAVIDAWANDEIIVNVSSDYGNFLLSKDIWDGVFIMASRNQDGLLKLDAFLLETGLFEKK